MVPSPEPARPIVGAIPTLRPTAIAFAVLALLGYALNDSGLAIPAPMCVTVVATLAFLTPLESSDRLAGAPDRSGSEDRGDAVTTRPGT